MNVVYISDIGEFRASAVPFLSRSESAHGLMLGVIGSCPSLERSSTAALLIDDERVAGVAFRETDRLLVCAVESAGVATFAEALRNEPARAMLGDPTVVDAMVARLDRPVTFALRQGVYENRNVVAPTGTPPGSMRAARPADLPTLIEWRIELGRVLRDDTPRQHIERAVRKHIGDGDVFVWDEDGTLVSTASVAGPTPTGIRVNGVYTPERSRGRGYASHLVACVTQQMLASGKQFVFLHTDLANPISNRIYERIGYRRIADFLMCRLAPVD